MLTSLLIATFHLLDTCLSNLGVFDGLKILIFLSRHFGYLRNREIKTLHQYRPDCKQLAALTPNVGALLWCQPCQHQGWVGRLGCWMREGWGSFTLLPCATWYGPFIPESLCSCVCFTLTSNEALGRAVLGLISESVSLLGCGNLSWCRVCTPAFWTCWRVIHAPPFNLPRQLWVKILQAVNTILRMHQGKKVTSGAKTQCIACWILWIVWYQLW